MDIRWKQQHHNDACACLAMLLSGYAVDVQDDDIITESKMPYRVRFDPGEGGRFTAGLGDRSPEVFNSMLQKHRLMISDARAADWEEFSRAAEERLSRQEPFMADIPLHIIPSPAYERFRQRADAALRHTVAFYASDDASFSIMDPWAGLDREAFFRYAEVKEKVDLRIDKAALRRELVPQNGACHVESLKPWDGKQAMSILNLLNQTREALDALVLTAGKLGTEAGGSPPDRHEQILYDYLGRCFKPIALDWRTAVEAQKGKAKAQFDLIEQLYGLQELVMKQQKELDQKPGIGREFCAELSKSALRIQQAAQPHLSSAYSIR